MPKITVRVGVSIGRALASHKSAHLLWDRGVAVGGDPATRTMNAMVR